MIQYTKRLFSSRISIIGLFTTLVIILSIPLLLVFSQQPQDIRQRAAEPSPNILPPINNNGYISGYVYDDKNENGTRDSGENGIQGVQIKITQLSQTNNNQINTKTNPDITSIVTTDSSGYFKYILTNGPQTSPTFLVKLLLPTGYKTINSNPIILNNLQSETKQIIEFGLFKLNQPTN